MILEREQRLPRLSVSKSKANRATIAGEASWVSFIRTAQHASGDSLRYEMVDGDADRCPTDLPVVPMQLSMREVVALGLMAGMQCTDVSFESQSLSMQGSAGTITSSRHPVLGALIHFAPKQPFETHGIRTNNGALNGDWIERLSDTTVVAGLRYDQRDRRHFEEDEGLWARSPSDRSMVRIEQEDAKRANTRENGIRRRHRIGRTQSDDSAGQQLAVSLDVASTNIHRDDCKQPVSSDLRRPQDGEWLFSTIIPESQKSNDIHDPQGLEKSVAQPSNKGQLHQTIPYLQRKLRMLIGLHGSESSTSVLPISELQRKDVQPTMPHLAYGQNNSVSPVTQVERARTKLTTTIKKRNHHLDKQDLGHYIAEKRQLENSQPEADSSPTTGSSQLLLMSKGHEDDPPQRSYPGKSSIPAQQDSTSDSPRAQYVADRWQHIFRQRQKERSRRRSQAVRTDSFGPSRTRQRSGDETESARSFDGAVQDRARAKEDSRRSSTWPLDGGRSLKNFSDQLFPRGMKLHEMPRQQRRQDIKSRLSVTGRQYISDSAYQDAVSSADEPENIAVLYTHRGNSLHRPRSVNTLLDEDPYVRRGRRRNSSLNGRRAAPGHSNGPLSYGNAPIPTASRRSAVARSHRSVDDSPVSHPRKVRMLSPSRSPPVSGDDTHQQNLESPTSPSYKAAPAKGILREPREKFPDEPNPTREGVAPARLAHADRSIPAEARWTKIDRRLVSPAALEMGDERFEERPDHVIVLRVLTKEEIEIYAMETAQIRDHRRAMRAIRRHRSRTETMFYDDYEPDGSRASSDDSGDSEASFERTPRSPIASGRANAGTYLSHKGRILNEAEPSSSQGLKERDAEEAMAAFDSHRERLCTEGSLGSEHSNIRRSTSTPPWNNERHESPPDRFARHTARPNWPRKRSIGPAGSARPGVDRRHSISLDEEAQSLTWEEELNIIKSENVLKYTRSSTNMCKDVSVTLQFFLNNQAYLDIRARDTLEHIKTLKNLLKHVLFLIEPLRHEKKTAVFVLNELDILMRSAQIPLSMLEKDFALFDITPLSLESRRQEWEKLMLAFQKENPFSVPEHLELSCRYGSELLANVKAGILSTPESDLLKSRICHINGFAQDSTVRHLLDPQELRPSSATPDPRRDATSRKTSSELIASNVPKSQQSSKRNNPKLSDNSMLSSDSDDRSSRASTLAESKSVPTGEVNWLWVCQTDIIPGYWATPWKHLFSDAVCLGAISVLLKVLEKFTTNTTFKYVESQPCYTEWHCNGKTTYPSYAHNSKGGIVVCGTYEPVKFSAFERPILAIELLHSYDHQVDRSPLSTTDSAIENTSELMGLDSWLSMAGRLPEIVFGPSDLLRTLPTRIQRVMTDFELEFSSLDRTSKDGGLQIIQTIAEGLLQTFKEESLSEAEQLFASLALLRTAKVGLCIARGPDTRKLADVLRHDVQVYLA